MLGSPAFPANQQEATSNMPTKATLDSLRLDPSERAVDRPPKGRWLFPVILALVVVGAGLFFYQRLSVPVVTTAVVEEVQRDVSGGTTVLEASGYVVARRAATVSSKVTGKVIEVLVEEGMAVESGQVLARLDDQMSQRQLALAKSEESAADSRRNEIRVRLVEARQNLKRTESLRDSGVATDADVDADQAELNYQEARLVAAGDDLEVAREVVKLRHQEIDDRIIRAPFTGVAISKNAQPGEMISPVSSGGFTRTGISTIVDMSSLEIEVDVNEAFINRVESDQRVTAVLDAYPEWDVPAHVITTVPTADRQKATVRVRIGFDALDSRVLPEMGVKVAFLEAESESGSTDAIEPTLKLLAPREALHNDEGQEIVWLVEQGKLQRRAVSIGRVDETGVEILSGVRAGDVLMIEGVESPVSGVRVQEL